MQETSLKRLDKIENSIFSSNSYILWSKEDKNCYLIDCGDTEPLLRFIETQKLNLKGIFLTHGHYDHIYGLNDIVAVFPGVRIYLSDYAAIQLGDNKLNYSLYHDEPFVYTGNPENIAIVKDNDEIMLWDDGYHIEVKATPGHDSGCITYLTEDYIFTGDSYIPGIRTVTNLRGNKDQAAESESKIKSIISERGVLVCPGHGDVANGILTSL